MKASKTLNLLFLGPQGSGKGTQAKLLAKKMGLRHLSSGEALRETAGNPDVLGRYLKKQLATGSLTPIPKLIEVFEKYIGKIPPKQGLLLDGFARQITETRILLRKLKKLGHALDAVVLIKIDPAETVKRLSKRAQCDKCNRILILGGKTRLGGRCPVCGGKVYQRTDDTPAAIRKRLSLYHRRTVPVIDFFKRQNLFININGQQTIPRVQADIVAKLTARGVISKK